MGETLLHGALASLDSKAQLELCERGRAGDTAEGGLGGLTGNGTANRPKEVSRNGVEQTVVSPAATLEFRKTSRNAFSVSLHLRSMVPYGTMLYGTIPYSVTP